MVYPIPPRVTTVTGTTEPFAPWVVQQFYRANDSTSATTIYPFSFIRGTGADAISRTTRTENWYQFKSPTSIDVDPIYGFDVTENFREVTEQINYVGAASNSGGIPQSISRYCSAPELGNSYGSSIITIPGLYQSSSTQTKFTYTFNTRRTARINGEDFSASVPLVRSRSIAESIVFSIPAGSYTITSACELFDHPNPHRIILRDQSVSTPMATVTRDKNETETEQQDGTLEIIPGVPIPIKRIYSQTETYSYSYFPRQSGESPDIDYVLNEVTIRDRNRLEVTPLVNTGFWGLNGRGEVQVGIYLEETKTQVEHLEWQRSTGIEQNIDRGATNLGVFFPVPNSVSEAPFAAIPRPGDRQVETIVRTKLSKYRCVQVGSAIDCPERASFRAVSMQASGAPEIGQTLALTPTAQQIYLLKTKHVDNSIQTNTAGSPTVITRDIPASWGLINETRVQLIQRVNLSSQPSARNEKCKVWTGIIENHQFVDDTANSDGAGRRITELTVRIADTFETHTPAAYPPPGAANIWTVLTAHTVADFFDFALRGSVNPQPGGIKYRASSRVDELIELWISNKVQPTDTTAYAHRWFIKADGTIDCDRVGLNGKFVQFENRECGQVQYNP